MKYIRYLVLACFLIGLIIQLVVVYHLERKGALLPPEPHQLVVLLLTVYSVHLSVIMGGLFGSGGSSIRGNRGTAVVAITLSALWNLLLVVPVMMFCLAKQAVVADLQAELTDIAGMSSFLVAGMLSYYFSRREKPLKTG
jgi:hypothetical protein